MILEERAPFLPSSSPFVDLRWQATCKHTSANRGEKCENGAHFSRTTDRPHLFHVDFFLHHAVLAAFVARGPVNLIRLFLDGRNRLATTGPILADSLHELQECRETPFSHRAVDSELTIHQQKRSIRLKKDLSDWWGLRQSSTLPSLLRPRR